MAIKCGITQANVGYKMGIAFPTTTGGGQPSQTLLNNAIEFVIEPDIEARAGITVSASHALIVTLYAADWVRLWQYENKAQGEASSVSFGGSTATFAGPPKCPSNQTIRRIKGLSSITPIDAVSDEATG